VAGAAPSEVFFPNRLWAMKADVLSRAGWQLRTRAGADVYLRLPPEAPADLWSEMLRRVPADGVALDAGALPASMSDPRRGAIRRNRDAVDAASLDPRSAGALRSFRAAQSIAPELQMLLAMPAVAGPVAWADNVMGPPAPDAAALDAQARSLRAQGFLRPDLAGHTVLSLPTSPRAQRSALLAAQRQTASAFALCAGGAMPAVDPSLAGVFSSATFPRKP
jgi:hypothetical protein